MNKESNKRGRSRQKVEPTYAEFQWLGAEKFEAEDRNNFTQNFYT